MMRSLAMVFVVVTATAAPAVAQTAGNFALDGFRPAMDSRGYLTVNSSEILGDRELSFGLGSLDWGHNLLALDGSGTRYSIDNVISATLVGALGLRVGPAAFELGISAPFSIMNGDRAPSAMANSAFRVDGQGMGNLGLHLKTQLLDPRQHVVGLGLIASVYLPTTTQPDRFLGDAGTTPQLMAVVDSRLGSRVRFALNGGIRRRGGSTFTNSDPGLDMAPVTNQSVSIPGTELPFGVGLAWAISPDKLDLIGEVFGSLPLGAHTDYQPLEALAGVKLYLAQNSFLSLGAGRGLYADKGGSPDLRAFIGIVFEPKPAARAHAHLPDDEMPRHEEPPPLADNDKVPDRIPYCADEPEADGCLPLETVIDTGSTLVLLKPINFEFDKAIITKDSYGILDDVVTAFAQHPDIALVEVRGHTDERGHAAYNLDLSQRRAAAVVEYLTTHGLSAGRLQSRGFGMTQPIDPAHNERAWEKNRRVEFSILKR